MTRGTPRRHARGEMGEQAYGSGKRNMGTQTHPSAKSLADGTARVMRILRMERERHGAQVPPTSPNRHAAATPSVHDISSFFSFFRQRKNTPPDSPILYRKRPVKVNAGMRKNQLKNLLKTRRQSLPFFAFPALQNRKVLIRYSTVQMNRRRRRPTLQRRSGLAAIGPESKTEE